MANWWRAVIAKHRVVSEGMFSLFQGWTVTIRNTLTGEVYKIPRIRAIFLVGALPCIPVLIAIGLAVQAVDVMTEVQHAAVFFALAAAYAGIAVMVLEDIRPKKAWAKVFVITGCEIAILLALYMSLGWLSRKADAVAWVNMVKETHDSVALALQYKWYRESLKEFQSRPAVATPQPQIQYRQQPSSASSAIVPPPMGVVEVGIGTGNDDAKHVSSDVDPNRIDATTWLEHIRNCTKPAICYWEDDIRTRTIELNVGAKGWARIFFEVFNIGSATIPHPTAEIMLGSGLRGVSIDRIDQRHNYDSGNISLELNPKETLDILPYNKTRTGYDYGADISVDPTMSTITLLFRIYAENLEAHVVIVKCRIVRD